MKSISLLVKDLNLVKELDDKAAEVFNGGGVECQYNNGEIWQCTKIEGKKSTTCQYNNGEIWRCIENNLNLPIDLGRWIDSSNVVTATMKS